MHDLVIYGAGGLGREMEGLVRATDPGGRMWNFLGFIDDSLSVGTMVSGYPVLGGRERLTSRTTPTAVAMGLTSPSVRADLYASLTRNPGIIFPTLVHPLAYVESSASLAPGAIVSPFCFVAVNASIGVCSFLNVSSQVGHDSVVGDFCAIMPGVGISGNVKIGARALIGAGAKILQGLSVGPDTVVGIGSVVLNDVPDYCTVMGYPARVIKKGG